MVSTNEDGAKPYSASVVVAVGAARAQQIILSLSPELALDGALEPDAAKDVAEDVAEDTGDTGLLPASTIARVGVRLDGCPDGLRLTIAAADIGALQAALNSYLRLIQLVIEVAALVPMCGTIGSIGSGQKRGDRTP